MSAKGSRPSTRPSWLMRLYFKIMLKLEQLLHMTCKQFIRRVSDKYDRPLSIGERILQSLHRGICHICRTQERHMDQLRQLAHEIGHESADDGKAYLSSEAIARIRAAMERAKRQ